jgi:hypothetical protein
LAERAVSVVADRALEERRWSTPDLLAVEQRLVTSATGRTGEQSAVVSHQAVREALAAHPTAGQDQQAMVRDLCQGGQGVAMVVGRAGTGKTFALGIARHAGQPQAHSAARPRPPGAGQGVLVGDDRQLAPPRRRRLADYRAGVVLDDHHARGGVAVQRTLLAGEEDPPQLETPAAFAAALRFSAARARPSTRE